MEKIILIVGPTGIGKTKLSIELAKKIDAEIINGDSVAIYKKLNIGSAKPLEDEREGIKHHLIDVCDVTENYTVYDYQKDVRKLIEEITARNKRIIIVGGTGLYTKAALFDYQFIPIKTQKDYSHLSNYEIKERIKNYIKEVDIHVNNRQRLVRLLNKCENNETISTNKDKLLYPLITIGLTTARDTLYERINKRVDKMIENGLLTEIEILKPYYKDSRILNSAIGYKEFSEYLFGKETIESVIKKIKLNSRHYAKRQYTFFKNQFNVQWFEVDLNNFNNTIKEVHEHIKNNMN